jgi:hypothetical protein
MSRNNTLVTEVSKYLRRVEIGSRNITTIICVLFSLNHSQLQFTRCHIIRSVCFSYIETNKAEINTYKNIGKQNGLSKKPDRERIVILNQIEKLL